MIMCYDHDMTTQELINLIQSTKGAVYLGTCPECSHELMISDDQTGVPSDEIILECAIMDMDGCVKGDAFKISELIN